MRSSPAMPSLADGYRKEVNRVFFQADCLKKK
jgi:hypothetical protein